MQHPPPKARYWVSLVKLEGFDLIGLEVVMKCKRKLGLLRIIVRVLLLLVLSIMRVFTEVATEVGDGSKGDFVLC